MSGQLGLAASLLLLVLLLAPGALVVRVGLIRRRGGVVACALRLGPGEPWQHGLAEYRSSQLCWYRSVSLRLRPGAVLDRAKLSVASSRPLTAAESVRLGPDVVIAECLLSARPGPGRGQVIELALPESGLTGLLAWLESSPQFYPRPTACGPGAS